jgi:predicted O-methyltransferase YrrM
MQHTEIALYNYLEQNSSKQPDLLYELERETWITQMSPQMISGATQGRLLSLLSKMQKPKRILEIGTFTGYSALCLAEGLEPGGELHTIEVDEELEDIILKYKNKSQYNPNITLHIGKAVDIIPTLGGPWDLIFLDADKLGYSLYYDMLIDQLAPGGIILADNVLWFGKVVDNAQDADTQALIAFNQKVTLDPRVENTILPLRDGLSLIRKL